MDKLNRKYVTLNPVEGSVDAYSSVSFDFTGAKDRMSLTVNGEDCDSQSFYVVVKDGTKFIGFYLSDLNKKSESKYELKKECGKLGSTLYTLRDVVAVEVVDKSKNRVLYQGIVDSKVGFDGKYTIVVDKPVVVKKEADPIPVIENVDSDVKIIKYDDMDNVEIGEMSYSNKDIGEGIQGGNGSGGSGGGFGGGDGSGGSGGGFGGGNGSGGSGGGFGGGNGSGGSGGGFGGGNGSGGSGGGFGGGNGSGGSGGGFGGGNGGLDHDHNHNHDHDCNCRECRYKIYYDMNECDNEVQRLNEDFEVFSKLYEGYLRSEYFSSLKNEEDDVLTVDRLEPMEPVDKSKTLVIKSTFRAKSEESVQQENYTEKIQDNVEEKHDDVEQKQEVPKDEKKRSKSVDDFYDNFLGAKGKNKGNSFVDMINHVKKEFDSIREIMSLSDEEFARRAEHEYKEPVNQQQRSTTSFAIRGLKDLIENRVEFKPFEMQGHDISWVQIKLNEVVGFFDNYWKLFWEPFVVEAYTENKHLLLGVERVGQNENYFFGVPAFYSMDVVNKAFDLGFELFEVVGNNLGEISEGVRGYFIKELKPTESYTGSVNRANVKSDSNSDSQEDSIIEIAEDIRESDNEIDDTIEIESFEPVNRDELFLINEEEVNV